MKNVFLLLMLLFPSLSFAGENKEICRIVLDMSEWIMQEKQSGVPLSVMLDTNKGFLTKHGENDKSSQAISNIYEMLVNDAYSQHYFISDKYNQEQINEFSSKHYLGCLRKIK
jgi:hypothetical protein